MAQRLSPQGYIYGEEPYSEHPFWEQEHVDANIEPITITPTDQQQVIEATALIDGYAPITVEPAPSSEPVIEPLSVTLTNQQQVITAPTGVDGYSPITVPAAPTPTEPVIQALSVTPSSQQQVITPPSGIDGYAPVTVAAVPAENLQSIEISPELEQVSMAPEPPYTGFSDVTVQPAIPLSMSNNQVKQCYYGTSSTSILNAQALCFDASDFKDAAEHIVGDYVITYFISVVVSSANYTTLEQNILNYWNTAISYQTNEGGFISIVAYTRGSTGGYTLHTIV